MTGPYLGRGQQESDAPLFCYPLTNGFCNFISLTVLWKDVFPTTVKKINGREIKAYDTDTKRYW
jgi:hypothetical protein